MPKLTIEQHHAFPLAEVKQRLDGLRSRLAAKYGIDARWTSDTEASFRRTGASGAIVCEAERVVVTIDLSFALAPLKGKVESRIHEELARALG